MNDDRFDVLVIGKGMIGCAALRHLSLVTSRVAIVGPDEPADPLRHDGVFASHYDQGRVTRVLSRDETWSELAARSLAEYGALETQTGVRFHHPRGCLFVACGAHRDAVGAVRRVADGRGAPYRRFADAASLAERFPFLVFPDPLEAVLEPEPAGTIDPRAMIRAQLSAARGRGATVVRDLALSASRGADGVTVVTRSGRRLRADRVVIATGAFTNSFALTRPLDLRPETETVLLARLSAGAAARLRSMPAALFELDDADLDGFYLLPPLRYPDGNTYLKLGANSRFDLPLPDLAALTSWMKRGDSERLAGPLRRVLLTVLPTLEAGGFETARCIVTRTPHGKPYLDTVEEGVVVAVGGNGAAAKSSDAIGKLAAELVWTGAWRDSLDAAQFGARFADA